MKMKKIAAVITAIVALFMFSVNCLAVVVNDVDKPVTTKVETYLVKIFDQIDTNEDIVYISGSPIQIYKLASGGDTTSLQTENLYTTVNTDSEGSASVSLPEGSYVIKEGHVTVGSKEYVSQDIQFTINNETSSVEVYLKHSPVTSDVTITEPATSESATTGSVPYTGSQIAVGAIAALCIGVAVAAIVVVTKKKDKNSEDDNADQKQDEEQK